MLTLSHRVSRATRPTTSTTRWQSRSLATHSRFREFFVLVSDRPDANRNRLNSAITPVPYCTFSGECLSQQDEQKVVGNAFACLSESLNTLKETLELSVYNQQKLWDLTSLKISPLLTVHSSNFGAISPPETTNSSERLVILPDSPNVLARRVEIRPRHAPNFVRLHNQGYVSWAGPVFENNVDVDADVSRRPFKGSVMVVNEKDWRGFMHTVGSDVYIKEGIWDLDKTSFIPFRTLLRRVDAVGKE